MKYLVKKSFDVVGRNNKMEGYFLNLSSDYENQLYGYFQRHYNCRAIQLNINRWRAVIKMTMQNGEWVPDSYFYVESWDEEESVCYGNLIKDNVIYRRLPCDFTIEKEEDYLLISENEEELYETVSESDGKVISNLTSQGFSKNEVLKAAEKIGVNLIDGKIYADACRQAAKKEHLPMEVVMAIGPENATTFKEAVEGIDIGDLTVNDIAYMKHLLLHCGIERRKDGIFAVLIGCSNNIERFPQEIITQMGQTNSIRIAKYLASKLPNVRPCPVNKTGAYWDDGSSSTY